MAGFLDKNSRVIDMILTSEGKRLLAQGSLKFVYFSLFDDEIDYDPYISQSGSMTSEGLSGTREDMIESSLVREAVSGYRYGMNQSGSDFTNVRSPLFSIRQGAQYIPRIQELDAPSGSVTLEIKQQKHQEIFSKLDQYGNVVSQQGPIDLGYDRFDSQDVKFDFQLSPPDVALDKQHQRGLLVRIFQTGNEGVVEIKEKRDSRNDLVFNNDLVFDLSIPGKKVRVRGR